MVPKLGTIAFALGDRLVDLVVRRRKDAGAQHPVEVVEARDLRLQRRPACVQEHDRRSKHRRRREDPDEQAARQRAQAASWREGCQHNHLRDMREARNADAHDRNGDEADGRVRQPRTKLVNVVVSGDDVQPDEDDALRPNVAKREVLRNPLEAADNEGETPETLAPGVVAEERPAQKEQRYSQQQGEHEGERRKDRAQQVDLRKSSPKVEQRGLKLHYQGIGVAHIEAHEGRCDGRVHGPSDEGEQADSSQQLQPPPHLLETLQQEVVVVGRVVTIRGAELDAVRPGNAPRQVDFVDRCDQPARLVWFRLRGAHKHAENEAVRHHGSEASGELRSEGAAAGVGVLDHRHTQHIQHWSGELRARRVGEPIPQCAKDQGRNGKRQGLQEHQAQRAELQRRPDHAAVRGEHRRERHVVAIVPPDLLHKPHLVRHATLRGIHVAWTLLELLHRGLAPHPLHVRRAEVVVE
mmetsp:Transcript_79798/g.231623  ORF Transcript_79798/g.231623 Transcript_79798/m.231623 type:complete len:467 (-) Transcript_79798:7-1407(-)